MKTGGRPANKDDPEDKTTYFFRPHFWAGCNLAAGYVFTYSRRFGPAVEELNEALQRNPCFAFARIILAVAYGFAGLAEEGYRQLEIASRLSPSDVWLG